MKECACVFGSVLCLYHCVRFNIVLNLGVVPA